MATLSTPCVWPDVAALVQCVVVAVAQQPVAAGAGLAGAEPAGGAAAPPPAGRPADGGRPAVRRRPAAPAPLPAAPGRCAVGRGRLRRAGRA
ncbi:MAG: hypothetical protein FJ054_06780 [Cyanobacteria bacterium M_surface_10_m2_119]|nr:hypothetical protein [Cyanobacteria bacterium M_surface_10_m2_119]